MLFTKWMYKIARAATTVAKAHMHVEQQSLVDQSNQFSTTSDEDFLLDLARLGAHGLTATTAKQVINKAPQ